MPTVAEQQAKMLRDALAKANGSPTVAAKRLGVSRSTVYRWMERYGVVRDS